jgi:hypothetical protein
VEKRRLAIGSPIRSYASSLQNQTLPTQVSRLKASRDSPRSPLRALRVSARQEFSEPTSCAVRQGKSGSRSRGEFGEGNAESLVGRVLGAPPFRWALNAPRLGGWRAPAQECFATFAPPRARQADGVRDRSSSHAWIASSLVLASGEYAGCRDSLYGLLRAAL